MKISKNINSPAALASSLNKVAWAASPSLLKRLFKFTRAASPSYCTYSLFLLFFCFSSSLFAQDILSKRIDFQAQKLPINDAILQIGTNASIAVVFPHDLFRHEQTVTFQAKNETVEVVLKRCLAKTDATYSTQFGILTLSQKITRRHTISGFIEDAESGERLFAATVFDKVSGKGTTTNEYGFFSLQLPEEKCQLAYTYVGYQTDNQQFNLKKSQRLTVKLEPSLMLSEVIVTPENTAANSSRFLLGKGISITTDAIEKAPPLAGENDILRALQLEMGVQSGADGIGGMHVRGGEADQNLVLLDGVPVYNPSHTFGLFSIFNSPTIKSARFVKDGFSARYGGRLSSVVDVRTKEGNNQSLGGEAEVSTLATKVLVEGPIVKDKVGFLLAARRTHIDPFVQGISGFQKSLNFVDGQTIYNFYDINAKIHARLSDNDRLFFSIYHGNDSYGDFNFIEDVFENNDTLTYNFDQQIRWGNDITALRWNHVFGERLFANTTVTWSEFGYVSNNYSDYYETWNGEVIDNSTYYTRFQSVMQDGGAKIDFDFFPSEQHHLLFGGGYLWRNFRPGLIEVTDSSFINIDGFDGIQTAVDEIYAPLSVKAKEYNIYLEDQFKIGEKWSFLAGLHAAFFETEEAFYPIIQPRFSAQFSPNEKLNTRISASRMTQFLHVLSTSGSGLPNDMWVPSTAGVRPQDAWQLSTAIELSMAKNWQATAAAYYKKLDHIISYETEATLPSLFEPDPLFWEEEITTGEGWNYGIETQIAKTTGKTTGALTYNWSIAERQFANINDNNRFPFRYSHPHQLDFYFNHQISNKLSINALWEFGSGLPITLTQTEFYYSPLDNLSPAPEESLSSVNGYRLPAYHRLDVNLKWAFSKKRWSHRFLLGIYNVYNRKNPYFVYELNDPDFPEFNGQEQRNVLPILPTFSYRIGFGN